MVNVQFPGKFAPSFLLCLQCELGLNPFMVLDLLTVHDIDVDSSVISSSFPPRPQSVLPNFDHPLFYSPRQPPRPKVGSQRSQRDCKTDEETVPVAIIRPLRLEELRPYRRSELRNTALQTNCKACTCRAGHY